MALSKITFPGDGVTDTFNVVFAMGFISESDVQAYVEGEVDGLGEQIYRPITFLTENLLQIGGDIAATDGHNVIFVRTVEKEELLVDYEDGDIMDENNLNTSQKQMIMAIHEALDGRLGEQAEDRDMGGFRITNMGTPVDPSDAVTKAYVDSTIPGNVAEAKQARDQAVAAAGTAAGHAGNAQSYMIAAGFSSTNATNQANRAEDEANRAENAANSASGAVGDAEDAAEQAELARDAAVLASGTATGAAGQALGYRDDAIDAKDDAEIAAGTATTQAGIATTQAGLASAARLAAENAASDAEDALEYLQEVIGEPYVILATGQSNMRQTASLTWVPADNLWVWDHANSVFVPCPTTSIHVAYSYANEVARAYPARRVYLVIHAQDGAGVQSWNGTGSTNYVGCKTCVEAALASLSYNRIEEIIWWQGETDATVINAPQWSARMNNVIGQFEAETWFSARQKWTFFTLSRWTGDEWYGTMNDIIITKALESPSNRSVVDTRYTPQALWTDNMHLGAAGKLQVGRLGFYASHQGVQGPLWRNGDLVQQRVVLIPSQNLGTARIPLDDTYPQITEGVQIAQITVTPRFPNSRFQLKATYNAESSTASTLSIGAIFRVGTASAIGAGFTGFGTGEVAEQQVVCGAWLATTTDAQTFTLRGGLNGAPAPAPSGATLGIMQRSGGTQWLGNPFGLFEVNEFYVQPY